MMRNPQYPQIIWIMMRESYTAARSLNKCRQYRPGPASARRATAAYLALFRLLRQDRQKWLPTHCGAYCQRERPPKSPFEDEADRSRVKSSLDIAGPESAPQGLWCVAGGDFARSTKEPPES